MLPFTHRELEDRRAPAQGILPATLKHIAGGNNKVSENNKNALHQVLLQQLLPMLFQVLFYLLL
jgi:hypothetical protein